MSVPAGPWAVTDLQAASGNPPTIRKAIEAYHGAVTRSPEHVAWRLSKAYFHYYDELPASKNATRTEAAEAAVRFGEIAVAATPKLPEAKYWYAQGLLAAADMKGAIRFLRNVRTVRRLMEEVRQEAPQIDDAGPDRFFAILYGRAPWPIGDDETAYGHAQRAFEAAPYRCANVLVWAKARVAMEEFQGARPLIRRLISGDCTASSRYWVEKYVQYGTELESELE